MHKVFENSDFSNNTQIDGSKNIFEPDLQVCTQVLSRDSLAISSLEICRTPENSVQNDTLNHYFVLTIWNHYVHGLTYTVPLILNNFVGFFCV